MMNREQLNETQQAFVDGHRAQYNQQVGDPALDNTNLITDDHTLFQGFVAIILGKSVAAEGCVDVYVPAWVDWPLFFPPNDFVPYVTDRAGPNGETMPIVDEEQMQMMMARAGGEQNPREAAAERREERADRRGFQKAVRGAVKRIDDSQKRQQLRQKLRALGVLGKDDDGDENDAA